MNIYREDVQTTCELTYHNVEAEFTIIFDYSATLGKEALIHALPEDCHPAEDDDYQFDNVRIEAMSGDFVELHPKYLSAVEDVINAAIEEDIKNNRGEF